MNQRGLRSTLASHPTLLRAPQRTRPAPHALATIRRVAFQGAAAIALVLAALLLTPPATAAIPAAEDARATATIAGTAATIAGIATPAPAAVASLPAYTTGVRFCNLTDLRRLQWGVATVPFPQGVWTANKHFAAIGPPSELVPFGARWPDGSVRFAQLTVLLDLQPYEEQVVTVGETAPQQLPPFSISHWTERGLSVFDWYLEVGVPGLGPRRAPLQLLEVLHASEVRYSFLFRARVPDTDLVYDLWIDLLAQQDSAPFEMKLVNSNTASPNWQQRVDYVDMVVSGAIPWVRGWARRGAAYSALSRLGPNRVHLLGPCTFADAQGQEWWGELAFWHPRPEPGVPLRTTTLLAQLRQHLFGCALNWAESGAFGPFGEVPPAPPWITDGGRAAALAAAARYFSWEDSPGGAWDDMPQGMLRNPSYTGEHADFGAAKLVEIVSTGLPHGIEEARLQAGEEACRPVHHREADGAPVTHANHPDWVAWGGRTHFSQVISPDRLGKPWPEPFVNANEWAGRDNQHWSSLTLASTYLLTASHSLLCELNNEAELYLASHTLPSLKPNWATNWIDEPRAVGRTHLSMSWNWLCTGREDLRERMKQRVIQCLEAQWRGGSVSGPVRPIGVMGPDPRVLPKYDFWKPWEESLAVLGLEATYQVTGAIEAHQLAVATAKTLITYGWKLEPNDIMVGTGVAWKNDGQPLTQAEYADPDKVLWSYGTGFNLWALPATKLALRFGQTYNDQDMLLRATAILQSLEANRQEPRDHGWDSYAGWAAVR